MVQGGGRAQQARTVARAFSTSAYDHLRESQIGVEEVAQSQVALSARPAEAGTVMFEIPDTHWLSLKTVSTSSTGDVTKGS